MQTTDIIRAVLDIIDNADNDITNLQVQTPDIVPNEPGEQTSRFRQILAMLMNRDHDGYANTPNEIVSGIASVTTDAGGGVNGSKHPADIRVNDPRGYEPWM